MMDHDIFNKLGVPEPTAIRRGPRPGQRQPEAIIQDAIVAYLKLRDWYVIETHGTEFQMGLPDIYACHTRYGTRWIEVKNPKGYKFTPAQIDVFPHLAAKGVGIWILTAATDTEYQKLFKPANWWTFLEVNK